MPDVETPVATPSPATEAQSPTQTSKPEETLSVPTNAEDYAEWRTTGKLPEKKSPSPKEESAPSKKTVTPDSEPGAQQKRQGNADSRKLELNQEIRDLIAQRDKVKQEVEAPAKKDVKPQADPSPAQPDASRRPVKPKSSDFGTWEEYEAADDKYSEDLADWKAEQKIQAYEQRQRQSAATQAMQARLDEAKSRYGDEAEPKIMDTAKTVFDDQKIAPAIKTAIGRSQVLVDALYVMGSDPNELASFVDLSIKDPLEALRKWYTVEALVKAELEKSAGKQEAKPETNGSTPQRDEDGKFLPARIAKKAPAPPTELGGSSSPPGDERDRAAATGNVRAFFQDANRRDIARWKGQT
jgi:hypothetical protein